MLTLAFGTYCHCQFYIRKDVKILVCSTVNKSGFMDSVPGSVFPETTFLVTSQSVTSIIKELLFVFTFNMELNLTCHIRATCNNLFLFP